MTGARGTAERQDAEKRESLLSLRDRYAEAQGLVSPDEPYANLQWILGVGKDALADPLALDPRTIEVVALWLQDLTREIDRRVSAPRDDEPRPASEDLDLGLAARGLRDATERFLVAFGHAKVVRPSKPAGDK